MWTATFAFVLLIAAAVTAQSPDTAPIAAECTNNGTCAGFCKYCSPSQTCLNVTNAVWNEPNCTTPMNCPTALQGVTVSAGYHNCYRYNNSNSFCDNGSCSSNLTAAACNIINPGTQTLVKSCAAGCQNSAYCLAAAVVANAANFCFANGTVGTTGCDGVNCAGIVKGFVNNDCMRYSSTSVFGMCVLSSTSSITTDCIKTTSIVCPAQDATLASAVMYSCASSDCKKASTCVRGTATSSITGISSVCQTNGQYDNQGTSCTSQCNAWYAGYDTNGNCTVYSGTANSFTCNATGGCGQATSWIGNMQTKCSANAKTVHSICAPVCQRNTTCVAGTAVASSGSCWTGTEPACPAVNCSGVLAGWSTDDPTQCLVYNGDSSGYCGNGGCLTDAAQVCAVSGNVTSEVFRQCGHVACTKSCITSQNADAAHFTDVCLSNELAGNNDGGCPVLNCTAHVLGWSSTDNRTCQAYGPGANQGWCDADGNCATATFDRCNATKVGAAIDLATCGSFECRRPGACASFADVAVSSTVDQVCLTSVLHAECPDLDCSTFGVAGWGSDNRTCRAFKAQSVSSYCDGTGSCPTVSGSVCAAHPSLDVISDVIATCVSAGCRNPSACIPLSATNTSSTMADVCVTNATSNACPDLQCTALVAGVNPDNAAQCVAYATATQPGFCDANSECLFEGSSNTALLVETCVAATSTSTAGAVLASCVDAQCARPINCAAGSLASSITATSFCFSAMVAGEGSCPDGQLCGVNGTCTAPPTTPEAPVGADAALIGGAVGGGVGGALALAGAIALAVFLVRRGGSSNKDMVTTVHTNNTQQQHRDESGDDTSSDDGDNGTDDGGEEDGEEEDAGEGEEDAEGEDGGDGEGGGDGDDGGAE